MNDVDVRLNEIDDCLYRVAVKAVIIENSKILLVKENDDEWWGLPGGGVDHGETVEQAIFRELGEELGIPSRDITFDPVIAHFNIGPVVDGIPKANLFFRSAIRDLSVIKPTEHVVESGWFGSGELSDLYLSPSTGEIKEWLAGIML